MSSSINSNNPALNSAKLQPMVPVTKSTDLANQESQLEQLEELELLKRLVNNTGVTAANSGAEHHPTLNKQQSPNASHASSPFRI